MRSFIVALLANRLSNWLGNWMAVWPCTWTCTFARSFGNARLTGRLASCVLFCPFSPLSQAYTVIIGDRSYWVGGSHEFTRQGLVWFPDCSKTEKGVGAAAWRQGRGLEVFYKLDTHATVFQAEFRAISKCIQTMLEGNLCQPALSVRPLWERERDKGT